jgi:hypothetical protein
MPVYPVWLNRTGLIGDLSEAEPVNFVFEAIGNDSVTASSYRLHSGELPAGLTFSNNYTISGFTNVFCRVSGTLDLVDETTVSNFTLRANIGNQFADSAYAIRVEGRDAPYFTANANVGNYLAGQYIANSYDGYQLTYVDQDATSNVTVGLSYTSNALPYGVDIVQDSGNWYIRGQPVFTRFDDYANPIAVAPPYGWPRFTQYDANIEISDGTFTAYQMFTIGVYARDYWSADSDNFNLTLQAVNTGNRAFIFGNSAIFVTDADYSNVHLTIGDGVVNASYLPSNTVIANITTAIEINGTDYTKLDLSNAAIATTAANATSNALFLETSFGSTDNDYLGEVDVAGNIVSGIFYSNANLTAGSLLTTANINAVNAIGSSSNVRIGANSITANSYLLNNYFGPNLASQIFRATLVDQGHPLIFTNPFPGSQGYAGRGYYSADMANKYEPILLDPSGALTTTVNGNFYAFKFNSYDPNGREVFYRVYSGSLPPGLTLNSATGFIYGYVDSEFDATYTFSIQAYIPSTLGEYISYVNTYNVFVYGRNPSINVWVTPERVGTVQAGQPSELQMLATSNVVQNFVYTIEEGQLPPGLKLSETGLIIGRPAFSIFESGDTSKIYTFTVSATGGEIVNPQGGIYRVVLTQQFTILVENPYQLPYNNLYIQAYPPAESQGIISGILSDGESMPSALIYRFEDPNFGIADSLQYLHATGLNVANSQIYFNSMQENHYHRYLTVGPFKTAVARNTDESIRYEVVYCEFIDDLVNNEGESVGMEVGFPPNRGGISVVYPNSLDNMRNRIYTDLGRVNKRLPLWMRSRQGDGKILGFVPAWVVCYTQPTASGEIAYRLNQRWGQYLNLINFELDRYELDNALTWNYTISTTANVDAGQAIANTVSLGTWLNPVDSGLTITAIDMANNTISITPAAEIVDIRVGDTVSVSGNRAAVNDSNLESYVTYVGNSQGLSAYFINQGLTVPANVIYANSYFSNANVYVSANGTPVIGYPTLQDTIVLSNAQQAGFGNASVGSNIYVVNEYVDDNRYNKYLLFPRVNIIN